MAMKVVGAALSPPDCAKNALTQAVQHRPPLAWHRSMEPIPAAIEMGIGSARFKGVALET